MKKSNNNINNRKILQQIGVSTSSQHQYKYAINQI